MAYTITLTDGTNFATISDGTTNTDSSVTLVGKNYAGYGQLLDENFIRHLENFSSTSSAGSPTSALLASPLEGQLWWDSSNFLLKVYNGSLWKTISAATSQATAPSSNVSGDLWYDTSNQQLKVYTGAAFLVVGPAYTSSQGTSGAVPGSISDGVTTHFVVGLEVNNQVVAYVSKDAQFTPSPAVTGFTSIQPGITVTSNASAVFSGTATNAQTLDTLDSTQFMRSDANTATTGRLQVNNANGIFIGTSNVVNILQSTNDGLVRANVSGGNLIIQANVAGTVFNVATALGGNGTFAVANAATVGTTLGVTGNITGGNILSGGLVSVTGNVTGGNIIASALVQAVTLSSSGNVQGGNLRTTGLISATGNIDSAANIAGSFFLGNGSQLTGLSAAVSVTKITNGSTEINAGTPGGNANVTIGGIGNVAVFTTSGAVMIGLTVPSIDKSGANATGNIGSSSNYFNRVFATATTALYADVAERFAADEELAPGTVVELGGAKEITRSKLDLSEKVFGVISTRPAHLMNSGAGEDDTHPPVAMTGRVPVQVVGTVSKGDRLVSAGNGIARAALPGEATAFNVIGRSLVDKPTPEQSTIEAIVTIK
jgi:hypothetical protein